MEEVKITNIVKFYTLILLNEKPHHGYDLIKVIGDSLDRKISPGQIYPFLNLLENKGYLKSKEFGNRDKKTYSLTRNGKMFVNNMLQKFGQIIHSTVESNVRECSHCDCEIYRGGVEKKINGKILFFCCNNCSKAFKL